MDTFGRMVRNLGIMAGWLLSSGVVMTPAMAATITYDFTGDVRGVSSQLTSQFNPSQGMSGFITVNSTDTNSNPDSGSYTIQNFQVMIGPYTATMGPSGTVNIGIGSVSHSLAATVDAPNGDRVNFLAPNQFNMLLFGPNNILTSDALPNPAPSISSFAFTPFSLMFGPQGSGTSVGGVVTSLTAVPLPTAALLFGGGLGALVGLGAGGLRRRRVSQA